MQFLCLQWRRDVCVYGTAEACSCVNVCLLRIRSRGIDTACLKVEQMIASHNTTYLLLSLSECWSSSTAEALESVDCFVPDTLWRCDILFRSSLFHTDSIMQRNYVLLAENWCLQFHPHWKPPNVCLPLKASNYFKRMSRTLGSVELVYSGLFWSIHSWSCL